MPKSAEGLKASKLYIARESAGGSAVPKESLENKEEKAPNPISMKVLNLLQVRLEPLPVWKGKQSSVKALQLRAENID